ncbi:MAG TPA: oligosaccharide flippase family protein [Terriglobales bacterium]|jgi:O-antigen/teichoic acid export membrane protein
MNDPLPASLASEEPEALGSTPSADVIQFRRQMGSISRHSSFFLFGTVFAAASNYLFKVYLARVLGADALGVYALGMTIVGFLSTFNALGLPKSAVRFVATYYGTGQMDLLRGFIGRSMLVLLTCNVLLGLAVLFAGPWIAIHFYHAPQLTSYIGLFALIMILGVLNIFLGETLVGYKAVARRTLLTNFISNPAMMVMSIVLVSMGFGLRGYILAQVASAGLLLVLLSCAVWRMTPGPARTPFYRLPPFDKKVISFSAAVFGLGFLLFFTTSADKVLIGFYLDARAVGMYAVANSLVTFVPIFLQSVNQIFSPTIADLWARKQSELLGRLFQTLTRWIFGLTIPLAMVMILFASPLMRIFGRDFVSGWPILVIGTMGQLVNCGVGSAGTLLLMSGNEQALIRIQGYMALAVVLLNLVLIPYWGITGAAVAMAVTIAMGNFWYLYEVRRRMGLSPYNRSYVRLLAPVTASVIVLLMIRAVFSSPIHEWVVVGAALLLAYLVFFGTALLVGLDADDRVIARAVWNRIRGVLPATEVVR